MMLSMSKAVGFGIGRLDPSENHPLTVPIETPSCSASHGRSLLICVSQSLMAPMSDFVEWYFMGDSLFAKSLCHFGQDLQFFFAICFFCLVGFAN
jgi:hypothetical protein